MANHVRKQLRDAIVTAVTGLTTTATRVFGYRVYAIQEGTELPALSVYITDEDAQPVSVHSPAIVDRTPTIHVRGLANASAGAEDTLDTIAKEVETALASGVSVGGKTVPLLYTGCEVELDAGDKPHGAIDLRFTARLFNSASTPDSLT